MGSGWHEWPLMIFTVLGQCVAGAVLVVGGALLAGKMSEEKRYRLTLSMIVLWVLMGIAFIASIMHLGSPLRAFNSLNRIGQSGLSNEIAGGSIFFAVGGFWWLISVVKKMPTALGKIWLVVTMALGIVFVWLMSRVYSTIDTVPTWYSIWTPLNFFMTMFIGGSLLGYILLRNADVRGCAPGFLPVIALLGVLVSAIAIVMQGAALPDIHSSVQQASALVPGYGVLSSWRIVLLACALALWAWPQLKGNQPAVATLSCAFVLVVVAELIGRGVFYGLHMTVGMAVAG
ncbi:dimethyl sulfoxide reductase anchor subunit family protein [Erwinia sp. HR93]|uniref:dimethyl sulfoxide reductase anchor subunit family protein n=1 Tax=Erwinia sp. HR93 TaxID=3094840 RepID=UPI002ADEC049|nr:dimethyl sulfoxide reductase anchor subunit family protein [Erwinia sp. HR93]MEA1064644.1 dimethyl sulfoxide reductase anchor subunit family protein [Erwinia sp. HR93]